MVGIRIGTPIGVAAGPRVGTGAYADAAAGPALVSIAVTPALPLISTTATQQMTATGTYDDTSTADITATVTWSSGTGATATIAAGGLATAVASGTTLITAQSGAISGTATLCVCSRDATSNIFCPTSQNGWAAVFTAAGVTPKTLTHSWGFQDASGNIVATVGTDLTAYGAPTYQASVTGWTRKALRLTEAAMGAGLAAGAAPNPASTSALWFGYIDITANPSAARTFFSGSNSGTAHVRAMAPVSAGGIVRISVNAVTADGAADHRTPGPLPFVLKYDRTNSAAKLYTSLEKITGTYNSGITDNTKGFPASVTVTTAACDHLLGAAFAGANAEWSDADVKAVLVALGWSPPW